MKRLFVFGMMSMMALTTEIAKADVCQDQAENFAAQDAQSNSRSTYSMVDSVRLRPGQDAEISGFTVWNRERQDTVTYVYRIFGRTTFQQVYTFNANTCEFMRHLRGGPAGVGTSDGGADW